MTLNALDVGKCLNKVMFMINQESYAQGMAEEMDTDVLTWANQGREDGFKLGCEVGFEEGVKHVVNLVTHLERKQRIRKLQGV